MKKLTVSLASLILVMSFAVLAFAGCGDDDKKPGASDKPQPSETPLTQQQINEKAQMALIVAGANMVMGPTDADFTMKLYTESAEQPETTAAMNLQLKGNMEDLSKLSAKLDGTVTTGGQETALAVTYAGTDLYVAAAGVKLTASVEGIAALVAGIGKVVPGEAAAVAVGSVALLAADATAPLEGLFSGNATYQINEDRTRDFTVNLNLASLKDTVPGIETIFPQPVPLAFSVSGDNGPFTSVSISALEIEGKKADLALTFKKAAFAGIAAPADKDTYTNLSPILTGAGNTVGLGYYEVSGSIAVNSNIGTEEEPEWIPFLMVIQYDIKVHVKDDGTVEIDMNIESSMLGNTAYKNQVYFDGTDLYITSQESSKQPLHFKMTPAELMANPDPYLLKYILGFPISFGGSSDEPAPDISKVFQGISVNNTEDLSKLTINLDATGINEMLGTGSATLTVDNGLLKQLRVEIDCLQDNNGKYQCLLTVDATLNNTTKPENVNVLAGLDKSIYTDEVPALPAA